MATEAASAGRIGAAVEHRLAAVPIIGRHHLERDGQFLEGRRHDVGQETLDEHLGIDQHRIAEPAEQIGDAPDPGGEQALHHLAAIVQQRQHHGVDVAGRHARRIDRADQRADRGAGNGGRAHTQFVQRLQHQYVRKPARAA